jgi:hypothetical protein
MADILDAIQQDEIADGLLGIGPQAAPLVAIIPHSGGDAWAEEGFSDAPKGESTFASGNVLIEEQIIDDDPEGVGMVARMKYGDAVVDARLRDRGQDVRERPNAEFSEDELATLSREERLRRTIDSRAETQKPQTEEQRAEQVLAAEPLTVERFNAEIASVDSFIKESGLSELPSMATLPHEIAGAIGSTPEAAGIDSQGVMSFASRALVSGLREIEQNTYMQPMPELAAREVGFLAAKMLGHDPRGEGTDLAATGRTMRELTNNILWTIAAYGTADPEKVNSRENIERYFGALQKALGGRSQFPFAVAKKMADAYVRVIGDGVNRLWQNQAQRAASQQAKPKTRPQQRIPRGLAPGIRGTKSPLRKMM